MTFAMVRGMSPLPIGTEWRVLTCRFHELCDGAETLRGLHSKVDQSIDMLHGVASTFERHVERICEPGAAECGP